MCTSKDKIINLKLKFSHQELSCVMTHEKTGLLPIDVKTKVQISCAVTAQLICAFVFTSDRINPLIFKSEISIFSDCSVRPSWKPP